MLYGDPLLSYQHHIMSRAVFRDRRSYDNLIRNGDAVEIDQSLNYICDEMGSVEHEFRHIVPVLGRYIAKAIRECAAPLVYAGADFNVQRCKFLIFEYFARSIIRQLVAENVTTCNDMHSHDDILGIEADLMVRWYNWFVEAGVHLDQETGFRREARQHYRVIRDLM